MLDGIGKSIKYIVTDDIRCYLTEYQAKKKSSKVTIDNIRRILSSFFSWLEDEDYILKSPVRRIHKVKTGTNIKETYSDEALELMRDNCTELRDLAMIDMLASTGMRVGEMVLLNAEEPIWERKWLTIEEAAAYSGIGRTKLRELSNQAGCPFAIWIGNKIHIVRERLDKYIDKQFRI